MGYNISTINNVPLLSGYYFFLVGKEDMNDRIASVLYRQFDTIAERLDSDSAIVKTFKSETIYEELTRCFVNAKWFRPLYNHALMKEPALIIMKPHPTQFTFDGNDFFALIPFETLERIYEESDDLVRDILRLSVYGEDNITPRLSASDIDESVWERIKDAVLLQPNFSGLGVDLKILFGKRPKTRLEYVLSKDKMR